MCPASAEDKYFAIRLIKYSFKKRKKIKNTRGVHIFFFVKVCTEGPHVFYMFYMNIFYVIGSKIIHTGLLKLYNQFYMNIP